MYKFPQLISSLLAFLILSPSTFADNPGASGYNSQDLTVNFPYYDEGVQPTTKRVLRCGALAPKNMQRGSQRSVFQDGKFLEFVLTNKESQKIIPAGTIATYEGDYRLTDAEGRPVPISQFAKIKTKTFARGEIFHCTLELLWLNGGFIVNSAFATVPSNTKLISWSNGVAGGTDTIIKQ